MARTILEISIKGIGFILPVVFQILFQPVVLVDLVVILDYIWWSMKEQIILEQFYINRDIRVYSKYAPTLRAERIGLLVLEKQNKLIGANETSSNSKIR